jgi:hypothetical protein
MKELILQKGIRARFAHIFALAIAAALAIMLVGVLNLALQVQPAYAASSYSEYWKGTYDWTGYELWEDCDWDGYDDHTGKKVPVGFDGTKGDNPSGAGANSQVAQKKKGEDLDFSTSTGSTSSTTSAKKKAASSSSTSAAKKTTSSSSSSKKSAAATAADATPEEQAKALAKANAEKAAAANTGAAADAGTLPENALALNGEASESTLTDPLVPETAPSQNNELLVGLGLLAALVVLGGGALGVTTFLRKAKAKKVKETDV